MFSLNSFQADASSAQENKVTVTLIAVVILFLVCQTPAATQLIYSKIVEEQRSNWALGRIVVVAVVVMGLFDWTFLSIYVYHGDGDAKNLRLFGNQ